MIIDFDALIEQMREDSDRWFGEDTSKNLIMMTLGLVGESGEVADIVKKVVRGSKDLSDESVRAELAFELIDVFHYWMMLIGMFGIDVQKVYEEKRAINEQRFTAERRSRERHPSSYRRRGRLAD